MYFDVHNIKKYSSFICKINKIIILLIKLIILLCNKKPNKEFCY